MKEKGIEDAIDAVKTVNSRLGRTVYTLDIFGQVDKDYEERFSELKNIPRFHPLRRRDRCRQEH